jgi:broad specificity phosphatase PhoE
MGPDPHAHDAAAIRGTPAIPTLAGLWLVRHGESAGNVARDRAEAAGAPRIELASRDMDLPLSPLGARQAEALARLIAGLPVDERPCVAISSPYARAADTARIAIPGVEARLDERLRERELGVIAGMTRVGIEAEFADQAAQMTLLGKFYHRPPGGESWCDVVLRGRGFLDGLAREHAGQTVLVVCHAVVVLCLRYVLERLTERQLLAIDADDPVANCAVTRYVRDPAASGNGGLRLAAYNQREHLARCGEPATTAPDRPVAAG